MNTSATASGFFPTSNNFYLLTDLTGSRRFICIEVEGIIDYQQPIDYKQLYAQAVYAVQHNELYWFTHEEETYIMTANRCFQHTLPEEELVHIYFRQPTNNEAHEEMSCAEIIAYI